MIYSFPFQFYWDIIDIQHCTSWGGNWTEKAMATHSSTLVGKVPWMEEPGRLQSTGSQRVGHDWATSPSQVERDIKGSVNLRFSFYKLGKWQFWDALSFKWSLNPLPGTSLVAQRLKHLSTMWETRVRSLGWEDPLEKKMAIHSSTIAWKIPWTEEPGRLQSMGSQRVGHDWLTSLLLSLWIE